MVESPGKSFGKRIKEKVNLVPGPGNYSTIDIHKFAAPRYS